MPEREHRPGERDKELVPVPEDERLRRVEELGKRLPPAENEQPEDDDRT